MNTCMTSNNKCKLQDYGYSYKYSSPLIFTKNDVKVLNKCFRKQTTKGQKGEVIDLCSFGEEDDNLDDNFDDNSFGRRTNIFTNRQGYQSVYRSKRFLSSIMGYSFREERSKRQAQTTVIADYSLQQIDLKETRTVKIQPKGDQKGKDTHSVASFKNTSLLHKIENNKLKEINFLELIGISRKLQYSSVKISSKCVIVKLNLHKGAKFRCELRNQSISHVEITEASHKSNPIQVKNTGEKVQDKQSKVITIRNGQGFNLKSHVAFGFTISLKIHFSDLDL